MNILVSNDDGVLAPGIATLYKHLSKAHNVVVIAPDRNKSGASNALTLDRPLEIHTHANGFNGVNGTPTDCVHLGVAGLLDFEPDIVVSGINAGANLGDDVLYSGTVAAAMEGRHLAYPPIAVSATSYMPEHFDTAAQVVVKLLDEIDQLSISPRTVLNVNVPDIPYAELKGQQVTRCGHRSFAGEPEKSVDPRGKERFWIAGVGEVLDNTPGTDFYAVEHNYVSITPLHADMTRSAELDILEGWLEKQV
ncbi:MAG: 5'/3'-nucleotidase SurE [Pontibacterium sp.]